MELPLSATIGLEHHDEHNDRSTIMANGNGIGIGNGIGNGYVRQCYRLQEFHSAPGCCGRAKKGSGFVMQFPIENEVLLISSGKICNTLSFFCEYKTIKSKVWQLI